MGLIGLMGLMGCSGGHVVEPDASGDAGGQTESTEAIAFSTNLPEQQAVTRSEPLETYAQNFKVWGYKNMSYDDGTGYGGLQEVFPGYITNWEENTASTTTTNSHDWEYVLTTYPDQSVKYWDFAATAYRFFAVAPANAEGTYTSDGNSITFTMNTDATDASDPQKKPYYSRLWFSTGQLPTYADKQFGRPVVLEFIRPLARVRFKFTYVYPREGIKLGAKTFMPTADYNNATPTGIARKGTVTLSFPLTGTRTQETLVSTTADGTDALAAFTEDWDPEDDSKDYTETDNGWYTVLPNNTQGSYTLTVNINGSDKTAVVPAEYMHWLPGYQYTYVFKITEEGGVKIDLVQSAFTQWTDLELNTTYEIYNW